MALQMIDADNHLYEPDDCFTRHIESRHVDRAMHIRQDANGKRRWYFGDEPMVFLPEAIDRTLQPGALQVKYRTGDASQIPLDLIETNRPEFRNPTARLKLLSRQGLQAAIVYHGVGLLVDHELRKHPSALHANLRSYNRWIEDDWRFAYEEKLFVPAVLTMRGELEDVVAELERVLAAGARLVLMRPGPIDGVSPADRRFDPFWARLNEARVPVVYHVNQAGYTHWYAREWGENPDVDDQTMGAFVVFTSFGGRPMQDTFVNLSLRNLFGRFPNLRVMSIENGAEWVKPALKIDHILKGQIRTRGGQMDHSGDFIAKTLKETMREHLWVAPFPEEDPAEVIDLLGAEHVLFGSDYPHPEGIAEPASYLKKLEGRPESEITKIMHDNAAQLLGLAA